MRHRRSNNGATSWTAISLTCWLVMASTGIADDDSLTSDGIDFAHQIQPILSKYCAKCHSGTQRKGGFSINTRQSFLSGGESGRVVMPGKGRDSSLIARVAASNPDDRMPPEGEPLSKKQVELLRRWIDAGLVWEDGFAFGKVFRKAPLAPRRPDIPAGEAKMAGTHPIDRFLHARLSNLDSRPADDRTFARRASLDLIGVAPSPDELQSFLRDNAADKRDRFVDRLLDDHRNYADHWLTFWSDLLRNAYQGTGFIDGGRRQITGWLYESLLTNKPYDQFVRELIQPIPGSEGFTFGIKWRGVVNESQRREIQAAQSVAQVFLGTNLKCASCHDSFVNDWKLTDAYGLASVFADSPLELHRCDKPTGKQAEVGFLFPELGSINAAAARDERQQQLADLLTKAENGRLAHTIVNRLWSKLFGRGLVMPLDDLDAEPWHRDLLDFLASDLSDHGYDLKRTLRLMATSRAYQLPSVGVDDSSNSDDPFEFRGPHVKRLTAEQFVDSVTTLTNTWRPVTLPLLRVDGRGQGGQLGAIARAVRRTEASGGRQPPGSSQSNAPATGGLTSPARLFTSSKWIWSRPDALTAPGGQLAFFRKVVELDRDMPLVFATLAADNSFEFLVNAQKVAEGDNWQNPTQVSIQGPLKRGRNVLAVKAVNGANEPNPAGLLIEIFGADSSARLGDTLVSDASWRASETETKGWEKLDFDDSTWTAAHAVGDSSIEPWNLAKLTAGNPNLLSRDLIAALTGIRLRAALLPQDQLQAALGRPHREQIVSNRESLASMLQALELTNGSALDELLRRGAVRWLTESGTDPNRLIPAVYSAALGREATSREYAFARELLGTPPTNDGVADLLWTLVMSPEFQLVP